MVILSHRLWIGVDGFERASVKWDRYGANQFSGVMSRDGACEEIRDLILRACDFFDFRIFPPESNQGLSRHEKGENRIKSQTLRSAASSRRVSKDGCAAPKSGLPDFGTKGCRNRLPADFGCSLPSFETRPKGR